jgi:gliding motility-associated-like protein
MKITLFLNVLLRFAFTLYTRLAAVGSAGTRFKNTLFSFFKLASFLLILLVPGVALAQFPYNEDFRTSTQRGDLVFGGSPTAFLTAGKAIDTGTDAEGQGYLRLTNNKTYQTGYVYSNNVFLGTYGLDIEFEYFTHGGGSDGGADGIGFFLFDATANPFRIGGYGGSLGYAQYDSTPGVSKGYLGIGIDEYGNYSTTGNSKSGGNGYKPNNITIRGAGDGYGAGDYPWLATTQTTNLPGTDDFNIAGNVRGATDGQTGYRKIYINLKPRPGGGLIINVRVKHDNVTSQIITNYQYTTPIPSGGLKYGIASSTGASVNYHEIRGLQITVDPNSVVSPVANNDAANICQGTNATIDIFNNDTRPNSNGAPNPNSVDLDQATAGVQLTKTTPEGTWTFDTTSQRLIFSPSASFSSTATVSYSFRDIYGAQSNVATVTVTTVFPKINSQPAAQTICENGTATFSVGLDQGTDNGAVNYQWQYNTTSSNGWQSLNDGVVNGATISGSQTKDLKLTNVPIGYSSTRFRVIVKSATAPCSAISNEASLRVYANAVVNDVLNQVVCNNRSTTAITFSGTNATTYTWTNDRSDIGLAASGTGNIASFVAKNTTSAPIVATITVTPTNTNNCPGTPKTFTIIVNPDVSIALTSTSKDRTLCVNTTMDNITYQVTNGTGATYVLPPGLTGAYDPATNVVTISGTPTQAGSFTYTITATGTCASATATGNILVRPNTALTLTSANATTQTPCINTAITDIVYSATNETDITVAGLPTGLTYTYTSGLFRITGRPTQVGTFNFTVTATGLCLPASASGTIVVKPNTTIAPITSNQAQTVCINRAFDDITFQITDGNNATVTGLPPGLSGTYDATTNIYTLKGTPTQAGTFNYTITATGSCANTTYSNTLTVNPDVTLTLGSSNNIQNVCINTNIQDITYTAANESNIEVSGLPAGVSGTYTGHTFTISGKPTEIGTFNYTVTATGTCEPAIATGTITVNPDVTIALTSANQEQEVCINSSVASVTYQITNGTNATATGLPPGVTGSYNTTTNIFTISGIPTQAGTFSYLLTATGNCAPATLTGKITVNPDVSIDPAPNNADQTVCVNTGLNDIVFTTVNATGATVVGLPAGVTGIFSNGTIRISGIPTQAGSFSYTITVAGNCVSATASGTITVNPDVIIALSSANNNQNSCINFPIVNITFDVTNGTTVSVADLPNGVTGNYNASTKVYTISGTPTEFGTFNYTVTANGLCKPAMAQGTLTVKPDVAIVLNSANQAQTVCINQPIQNIVYTTTYETNVTVTGLPAGLQGDYAGGSFVVSGTPSEAGTFSYTVTATGECVSAIATGIITVNPDATITLSSGNNNQNICINTAVVNITFNAANSSSVSASDLPDGLSGVYNAATKVFTISGTATKAGTFNYTVTASGACKPAIATGTIIVKPNATIVLNSANQTQTVCIDKGIQNIVYTATNATVVVATGLPAGITGNYLNGTFIISGSPTESGSFPYTVTASGDCAGATASGIITVTPDAAISLSSANNDQNICINTSVANITFNVTNSSAVTVTGLPAGLTGSYDPNTKIFTISGSATQAGTFGYTVTASGACEPAIARGTIIVKPDVSMVLNSANEVQTLCVNTAVQNIVYTLANETNATVSGLPPGVVGTYTNGSFIISGTPTQDGPFSYTVTATGACAPVSMNGVITVNPDVTISLTTGNNEQTICINRGVASISYTLTNSTGASVTGLPPGVTGTYSNGTFVISGTATQSGTFNYTVTGTGLCRSASLAGKIIVNPDVTIQLASANENQTVCVNTAFRNITYTVANETNVTVTGLPTGVTGNYINGSFVISGTPSLAGSFPYTVTATGNCVSATASGTLIVNPDVLLVLSSTNKDQTLCINTVFSNITYTATNATAATVTGLPTGLTYDFTNGVVTISGTPTQSGLFTYTVTATGLCVPKILSGEIRVNPDVAIAPNTTTANQIVCINTPIQNIDFRLANSTGATVTNLPQGVTGTYTDGSFVISGRPTQSGIFNYTVTATGTCLSAIATGTLTVNPDVTLVLSSANKDQELCVNTVLNNITYTATNGTAASVTGLPAGLTGSFASGVITISGTATESGTFTYTVTATGLCTPATLTGKITVNPDVVITANTAASQTLCINTQLPAITFSLANATGATVTNLPLGVTGSYSNGSFVISGRPTQSGTFTYTVTATGLCISATATGTLTVNPDVTLVIASTNRDETLCINTPLTNIVYTATNATAATVTGLPNGLTGRYSAGVITISGTPTEYGSFPYTVTATGQCTPASLRGTITVNPDVVIAPNTTTSSQTLCINTQIQTITFSLANATGATVTKLPAGVTGVYSNGSFVISGTPTQAGSFLYTVTATGACVSATATGTLTVNPDVTLVLSSGSQNETLCINTALTNITYTAANATAATVTGLPGGLTGNYANGIFTISGTPTQSGRFNYTVTATGLCTPASLNGTIIVNPDVSITANSVLSRTLCINTALPNITFSLANATAATVTGLPRGVTGTYTNGSFVISGTPTEPGLFSYTIKATGACAAATISGTITVNPDVILVLSSASKDQTLCINTVLQNITYTVTNATSAIVTGLPGGLTGTYANGVFTITGTPTQAGTFNYSITASGLCQPAVAGGTIKVNPDVSLTLSAANSSQTICINTAVQNITYAVANATSVSVAGLPPGLTGNFANGVFIIRGTATVAGTYNYTVTATGTCAAATAAGQIIVTPNAAIALSSASGTNNQSVCLNLPLTTIQYTITNANGATVTGLPGGITGNYANGIFTISGAATQSGTFNYTVTTTGGCASASLSGTIFVAPNAAIALSSAVGSNNQSICVNTGIATIRYQVTNATGAVVTGLPAGLSGVYANGLFTITGTATLAGTYSYTVTTTGGCASASLSGTVLVNPDATITLSSATTTDNQTICVNTAVTAITYSTTAVTGAGVTGLPQGLTASYNNGTIQISGRATQTGTFNYLVTASGNCKPVQISGSIQVNPMPAGYNDIINNLSCENSRVSYTLQDNVNNTAKGGNGVASSFVWTIVPNSNIAGLTGGAGSTIIATLKNLSHQVQQAIYVVTPTSVTGGCPGQAFTVTVNVPVCSNIIITKTADVSVIAQAGDKISYTIAVKNNGAANHSNIVVKDPYLGGILTRTSGDNGNNILEADETWVYGGVYTVTQDDIDNNGKPANGSGKIINTATVNTAEHPELLPASAEVSINSTGDVVLIKTGVMSRDFATITYTFKITNNGNVRLTNLRLIDTKFAGNINLNNTTLEVGASITATAMYTVTDNEKRDGRVMNTATVNGTTPAGGTVSDVSGTQANNDEPTLHIIDDAPQAINDRAETMINNPVTFSITANDLPSFNGLDAGSVVITTYPRFGTLTVNMDGTVTYTPNRTFSGQDSFMYTVTDYRGKLSNRALVNITVTPIDLFIPNTFTPNGDGKNDTFKIVGKESFDSIELLIFNRWGNEVYRSKNYQDDWDGSGLNEGTYYYVITLKKGADQTAKKGWILLKR